MCPSYMPGFKMSTPAFLGLFLLLYLHLATFSSDEVRRKRINNFSSKLKKKKKTHLKNASARMILAKIQGMTDYT
jgi:hypothetical protein